MSPLLTNAVTKTRRDCKRISKTHSPLFRFPFSPYLFSHRSIQFNSIPFLRLFCFSQSSLRLFSLFFKKYKNKILFQLSSFSFLKTKPLIFFILLFFKFPPLFISAFSILSLNWKTLEFGLKMASNIGIMDSAYFVGRNEILTWINNRLQLNLSRIEEVSFSISLFY